MTITNKLLLKTLPMVTLVFHFISLGNVEGFAQPSVGLKRNNAVVDSTKLAKPITSSSLNMAFKIPGPAASFSDLPIKSFGSWYTEEKKLPIAHCSSYDDEPFEYTFSFDWSTNEDDEKGTEMVETTTPKLNRRLGPIKAIRNAASRFEGTFRGIPGRG